MGCQYSVLSNYVNECPARVTNGSPSESDKGNDSEASHDSTQNEANDYAVFEFSRTV